MSLWSLSQAVLLFLNAVAILNESRFLDKRACASCSCTCAFLFLLEGTSVT